jgi:hypothetical protein
MIVISATTYQCNHKQHRLQDRFLHFYVDCRHSPHVLHRTISRCSTTPVSGSTYIATWSFRRENGDCTRSALRLHQLPICNVYEAAQHDSLLVVVSSNHHVCAVATSVHLHRSRQTCPHWVNDDGGIVHFLRLHLRSHPPRNSASSTKTLQHLSFSLISASASTDRNLPPPPAKVSEASSLKTLCNPRRHEV